MANELKISSPLTINGNFTLPNQAATKYGDTQVSPNFVTVQAPTTISSSYPIVWPTSQGGGSTILVNDGLGNLSWGSIPVSVTGDINQTSFSIANNVSSATNVTGLAFANASVRSAIVQYSVIINATTSLYEAGTLSLIQKGSSWEMSQTTVGDNSLVVFTVTTAGQIQYTSANYAGFTTAKMQFRATVTSV